MFGKYNNTVQIIVFIWLFIVLMYWYYQYWSRIRKETKFLDNSLEYWGLKRLENENNKSVNNRIIEHIKRSPQYSPLD